MKVALFGPDGNPIVFEGSKEERNETLSKAIMIECFGALNGLQLRDEWLQLPGGAQTGFTRLLDAIIDQVGREAIVQRFSKYGVRFAEDDPGGPPAEPAIPQGTPGHTNPANPYKVIQGGKA